MSEVEKMNSSSGAESADQPCGLTETQHSAGWRCTMCDALAPEYERCCASCAMPSSIVGCVRAMWDEYNRDEQCDYTAINRLIEHAADLADPEGVWDLSSEAPPLSPAEGRAGNPVADDPLPTLQSQARRVEELEGAVLQAAIWFEEYADHHQAKGARDKASRNLDRADYLRRAHIGRSALSEGSGSPVAESGSTASPKSDGLCKSEGDDPALSEAMGAVDRWLDSEHHRFPSAPISSSVATIYYALEARLKSEGRAS